MRITNATFVHGKPTEERYNNPELPKPHDSNWFPWIRSKLEAVGIRVSIPAMPRPYHPDYTAWKEVFEAEVINADSALIGFSAGGDFALHWLSENREVEVEELVLVAPYRDEAGKYGDFSKYELDGNLAERVGQLTIISSLDDTEPIQHNARRLAAALPLSQLIELNGYGHFMIGNNMTSPEFPELYDILVR